MLTAAGYRLFLLSLPLLVILPALLGGCTPMAVRYTPSSTLYSEGSVAVGNLDYKPAENGKIGTNQIRNTSLLKVRLDRDVSDLIRSAIIKEFRYVGIVPDSGYNELTGRINDFFIDDRGFSVDWMLDIDYLVRSKKNDALCYKSNKVIQRRTGKYGDPFAALNDTIRLNVEEILKDKRFKRCISEPSARGPLPFVPVFS